VDVCVYRELLVEALTDHESLEVVGHTPADIVGMAVGMTEPRVVLVDTATGKDYALDRSLFVAVPASGEVNVQLATRRSTGVPILNAIRVTNRPDH
jgi:hypothetical protein